MTLTQLQVLIALADAGGFSAAAARLGISQSAVSHALAALEKSLAVSLVDRRQNPPALTDAGHRLIGHARGVVAQADALVQEAAAARGLASGVLRIGSFGPTTSVRLLPELLAEFTTRYPGIELRVDEAADDVVDQWLVERRVELGFVTLPDDRFDTVPLFTDEFVALLPSGHPLAALEAIRLQDLTGLPFILTGAGSQHAIEALLAQAGARPRVQFRFGQALSILGLVQHGIAVSMLARGALPAAYPGVVYRPLSPAAPRETALAMLDEQALSPVARAFVEVARASVRRQRKAAGTAGKGV